MKAKFKKTGEILDVPDAFYKANPDLYEAPNGQANNETNLSTDQNSGMRTLYQQLFTKATTIKDRDKLASSFKTATGEDLFGKTTETAEQTKKKEAKQNIGEIMNQLEDFYNTNKLAGGWVGELQGGGLMGNIGALAKQNPNLVAYKKLRESVKPQLAKAAGDVGNLAIQEQLAAIGAIPTEYNSPEEAKIMFQQARKKFGLPNSQKKVRLEDIFK